MKSTREPIIKELNDILSDDVDEELISKAADHIRRSRSKEYFKGEEENLAKAILALTRGCFLNYDGMWVFSSGYQLSARRVNIQNRYVDSSKRKYTLALYIVIKCVVYGLDGHAYTVNKLKHFMASDYGKTWCLYRNEIKSSISYSEYARGGAARALLPEFAYAEGNPDKRYENVEFPPVGTEQYLIWLDGSFTMRRAIVEYEGLSKNLVPVFKVLGLKDKGLTNIKGKVLEIGVNAMIYLGKVPPKIKPKYSLKEFAKVMKAKLQSEGYTKLPQKEIKSHAK